MFKLSVVNQLLSLVKRSKFVCLNSIDIYHDKKRNEKIKLPNQLPVWIDQQLKSDYFLVSEKCGQTMAIRFLWCPNSYKPAVAFCPLKSTIVFIQLWSCVYEYITACRHSVREPRCVLDDRVVWLVTMTLFSGYKIKVFSNKQDIVIHDTLQDLSLWHWACYCI